MNACTTLYIVLLLIYYGFVLIVVQTLDKVDGQDKETAFVRNLRTSICNKKPLRVNRRGLVKLNEEVEKPAFSANELYRNRQRGLSCKAIAKKIGVDTSKDEVVQISRVLKTGCGKKMPDIESIKTPYKRVLPTPLWYLWESELEVIEESALPSRSMIMGQNPHVRIVEKLGDDSFWMLQVYLTVQRVVHDEIMYSFQSAASDSPLGELEDWSNHLGSSLLDQALKIERSVCEAAYQTTPNFPGLGQGRCKCGAVKSLKFKWKEEPIPHPSFFWGCVKYTISDRSLHDPAKSCSDSIWEALDKYRMTIGIKELEVLLDKFTRLHTDWIEKEASTVDLDLYTKVYGGPCKMLPFTSAKQVCAMLEKVSKMVNECIPIIEEEK